MITKIIIGLVVLACIIVYFIAKSMKEGNNVGNFIEEEEINHESRRLMGVDYGLEEFVNDINNQKDGGIIG